MKANRPARKMLAAILACAALAGGCTTFVGNAARESLADFFTTVLSEAVDTAILPNN